MNLINSQTFARNSKGPAERDLICQARAKYAVMRFLFDVLVEDARVVEELIAEAVKMGLKHDLTTYNPCAILRFRNHGITVIQ